MTAKSNIGTPNVCLREQLEAPGKGEFGEGFRMPAGGDRAAW